MRSAWIDLLIGQLPSHRSNAQRSAESADAASLVFGVDPSLLANYWRWEIAYVEFLESIRHDRCWAPSPLPARCCTHSPTPIASLSVRARVHGRGRRVQRRWSSSLLAECRDALLGTAVIPQKPCGPLCKTGAGASHTMMALCPQRAEMAVSSTELTSADGRCGRWTRVGLAAS